MDNILSIFDPSSRWMVEFLTGGDANHFLCFATCQSGASAIQPRRDLGPLFRNILVAR